MRLKTLTLSVVVLAVLSGVVYFARRPAPPPSTDARLGQPMVDRTTVEKAARLRISDQGKTVTLARQADGSWRDQSYHDLPADFSKLSGFVNNLREAKLDRLVTTNPDRLARLEFKDTKIELLDSADKPLWSVTLGKQSETGSGRFVRFDEEKKAYLAALNAWIDAEAKSWAESELLNVKPEDIAKVEAGFPPVAASETEPKTPASPAGTVTLSRAKKDDPWKAEPTPASQKVAADKVSSLLGNLTALRFSDTTEPNDPKVAEAKAHERVFTLTTFGGKTYTVAIGRKPEEKKLKPPVATTDGKTGPASLGSVSELAKQDDHDAKPGDAKAGETKPLTPEYETIPAGPVYVSISSSDAAAPVNALMQKRAFQVNDYTFTSLPQKPDELFEPAPPPPAPAATAPAEGQKTDSAKAVEAKPEPAKPAEFEVGAAAGEAKR